MCAAPTTEDIILDRAVRGTDCQRCVDWAIGMLMQGHETDYLGRLAGQIAPFELDTISHLGDSALAELGFDTLDHGRLICGTITNMLISAGDSHEELVAILECAA